MTPIKNKSINSIPFRNKRQLDHDYNPSVRRTRRSTNGIEIYYETVHILNEINNHLKHISDSINEEPLIEKSIYCETISNEYLDVTGIEVEGEFSK